MDKDFESKYFEERLKIEGESIYNLIHTYDPSTENTFELTFNLKKKVEFQDQQGIQFLFEGEGAEKAVSIFASWLGVKNYTRLHENLWMVPITETYVKSPELNKSLNITGYNKDMLFTRLENIFEALSYNNSSGEELLFTVRQGYLQDLMISIEKELNVELNDSNSVRYLYFDPSLQSMALYMFFYGESKKDCEEKFITLFPNNPPRMIVNLNAAKDEELCYLLTKNQINDLGKDSRTAWKKLEDKLGKIYAAIKNPAVDSKLENQKDSQAANPEPTEIVQPSSLSKAAPYSFGAGFAISSMSYMALIAVLPVAVCSVATVPVSIPFVLLGVAVVGLSLMAWGYYSMSKVQTGNKLQSTSHLSKNVFNQKGDAGVKTNMGYFGKLFNKIANAANTVEHRDESPNIACQA